MCDGGGITTGSVEGLGVSANGLGNNNTRRVGVGVRVRVRVRVRVSAALSTRALIPRLDPNPETDLRVKTRHPNPDCPKLTCTATTSKSLLSIVFNDSHPLTSTSSFCNAPHSTPHVSTKHLTLTLTILISSYP